MKLLPGTDSNPEFEENTTPSKQEMKEHTETIMRTIQKTFIDLKTEITTLKESNIDLVRLLSSQDLHETNRMKAHDEKNVKSTELKKKNSEMLGKVQGKPVKKTSFAEKTNNKTTLKEINAVIDDQ